MAKDGGRPPREASPAAPARRGPSWVDERADERGDLRVMQGFSALRADRVYDEAQICGECAAARVAEGRDDALCDAHMAEALGMQGGWLSGPPGRKLR
jgi:hypothetical protein